MRTYDQKEGFSSKPGNIIDSRSVQLLLGFGPRKEVCDSTCYPRIRQEYPAAEILLCSTAGQIYDDKIRDDVISLCEMTFEKTMIRVQSVNLSEFDGDSSEAGRELIRRLGLEHLPCHILIFSDGGIVNGSKLVEGVNQIVRGRVPVTGGLAGDGFEFSSTCVGINEIPQEGKIVALAFYSNALVIGYGSRGGWEVFGPSITVTRSIENRVYELNGKPALGLYKKYLGPYSDKLPVSALYFPLSLETGIKSDPVVRTILSIDKDGCMVFAGDVPEGSMVRFTKANFDKLIDAAADAAYQALPVRREAIVPALALLISCVGRKIVLDHRIDEEVEVIREIYGKKTLVAGFYSYGEICPSRPAGEITLHNQTMTITTIDEI